MGLRNQHRGIEGYFYKCGNRKLTPCLATIERASYGGLGHFVNSGFLDTSQFGLHLSIKKDNRCDVIFSVYDTKDIASIFRELNVSMVNEINTLPFKKRRVTMYAHDGMNYGISLKED